MLFYKNILVKSFKFHERKKEGRKERKKERKKDRTKKAVFAFLNFKFFNCHIPLKSYGLQLSH
jgi:hypothetical protein